MTESSRRQAKRIHERPGLLRSYGLPFRQGVRRVAVAQKDLQRDLRTRPVLGSPDALFKGACCFPSSLVSPSLAPGSHKIVAAIPSASTLTTLRYRRFLRRARRVDARYADAVEHQAGPRCQCHRYLIRRCWRRSSPDWPHWLFGAEAARSLRADASFPQHRRRRCRFLPTD